MPAVPTGSLLLGWIKPVITVLSLSALCSVLTSQVFLISCAFIQTWQSYAVSVYKRGVDHAQHGAGLLHMAVSIVQTVLEHWNPCDLTWAIPGLPKIRSQTFAWKARTCMNIPPTYVLCLFAMQIANWRLISDTDLTAAWEPVFDTSENSLLFFFTAKWFYQIISSG